MPAFPGATGVGGLVAGGRGQGGVGPFNPWGAAAGMAGQVISASLRGRKSKKKLTPEEQAALGTDTLGTAATGGVEVGTRLGRSRGY